MRVSYNWLRELLPALDATPAELAERLTLAGLYVESEQRFGSGLEHVVVSEVRRKEPHPRRSELTLVTVDRGAGQEQRIVCGAANVPEAGGLVVLAPLGSVLPALGEPLAAREIGGVRSEGMLCSEAELGLADASEGILVLPAKVAVPGTSFAKALPNACDVVFDLSVTPNRPDALGHVGLAREAATLFGLRFALPEVSRPPRELDSDAASFVAVDNQGFERCPHYAAGVVVDVSIAPSPLWLRWRLHTLGIRSHSNVVDITNLLLLEFGQPMHAFDLERVRGSKIVVRPARNAELFTTLDGVRRQLSADDLVICDAEAPSALAGVMGGQDSEIREQTRRVLLECAYFTPRGVRRTARRHGLHTESSYRFERGVDWGAVPYVLERAKALLSELTGGVAARGAVHAKGPAPPLPVIKLRSRRLDSLLGAPVPFDEASAILASLGLSVERVRDDGDGLAVKVTGASHRPDISLEADLIEEVARVRGFDRIPSELPAVKPQPPRATGKLERELGREAVSMGLSEAVTYAFVSRAELENVRAPKASVVLTNPLSEDRAVMRTSLLPGLLEALRRARRRGERAVRLFTTGSRFLAPEATTAGNTKPTDSAPQERALPEERPSFAAVLAGPRAAYLSKPEELDVYDAKGFAIELVERLIGRPAGVFPAKSGTCLHLHPKGAAQIRVERVPVGVFGPLHPDVVDAFDLDGPVQVVELDLDPLEQLGKRLPKYMPIPRLPAVARDISLTVRDDLSAGEVENVLRAAAGELCESVELFDLFRGGAVPEGHRSLAFRIVYRDPQSVTDQETARTLTDKEVDEHHARVLKAATQRLGGIVRA